MIIRSLCFFLIISTTAAHAQKWPFELWHDGKIVLQSGDTLKGFVKYDLQQDMVQYNIKDKVIETFTARKVLFFEIFDTSVHKYRQFFTIPYNINGSYSAPIFFELLAVGKITLLAREALEYKTYNTPYYVGSYSRLVLVNKFFLMDQKENITTFTGTREDLLDLMEPKSEEVRKYMKENHFDITDKYDLAKVVDYYNSLTGI